MFNWWAYVQNVSENPSRSIFSQCPPVGFLSLTYLVESRNTNRMLHVQLNICAFIFFKLYFFLIIFLHLFSSGVAKSEGQTPPPWVSLPFDVTRSFNQPLCQDTRDKKYTWNLVPYLFPSNQLQLPLPLVCAFISVIFFTKCYKWYALIWQFLPSSRTWRGRRERDALGSRSFSSWTAMTQAFLSPTVSFCLFFLFVFALLL